MIEPLQARFPQHRLQPVGQADLHALAAADAAGEKLGLVLGPRGPDEKFVGPPGQGAQADQGHGHDSRRHRGDELASPQVQGGPGRLGSPDKAHPVLFLAGLQAAEAELAFGRGVAGRFPRGKGGHLTHLGAVAAVGAEGRRAAACSREKRAMRP